MENLQLQNNRGRSHLIYLLPVICICVIILIAWWNESKKANAVPSITTEKLKELVDVGADIFLLDVRTEPEFIAARLSFTDLRVPYDSLESSTNRLPQNKNSSIYCFCRSGRRSAVATRYLLSVGYTKVYNVTGGIVAWQKQGFETVNGTPLGSVPSGHK